MTTSNQSEILPQDEFWMGLALSLAETASSLDEVPVGCIIVKDQKVIASGFNLREYHQCVLEHAELRAIEEACGYLGSWRLNDCTLYCTLEPCLMCAGAAYQARIPRLVFAAADPKAGAMGSLYDIHNDSRLNHQIATVSGVRRQESQQLLRNFFRSKRQTNLK